MALCLGAACSNEPAVATANEASQALDSFLYVDLGLEIPQRGGQPGDQLTLSNACQTGVGLATLGRVSDTVIEATLMLDQCGWPDTNFTGELSMTIDRSNAWFEYASAGDVTVRHHDVVFELLEFSAAASAPVCCWEALVTVVEGELALRPGSLDACRNSNGG